MNLMKKISELSEKRKLYIISIWILILIVLYIIKYFAFVKIDNKKMDNNTNNIYSSYDLDDESWYINEDDEEDEEDDEYDEYDDIFGPVENFSEYCKKGKYDEAYNMLSDNNKKTKFSTLEDFEKYIKSIFDENSIYNVTIDDIFELKYTIEIYDDIMSTGKWEKNNLREINVQIIIEENDENEEDEDKIEIL